MTEFPDEIQCNPAPYNGVVPEAARPGLHPDERHEPTAAQVLTTIEAGEIAREAEDLQRLLQRWQHDPDLFQVLQDQFGPLVDPLRRTVPSADRDEEHEPYPYGDAFNARLLVQRHRHELRYCFHWKTWLIWSGTHWQRDHTGVVWQWLRHAIADLSGALDQLEPKDAKACLAHIAKSLQAPRMEGTLKHAASWDGISIGQERFDTDPWSLNLANGTLDLRTGMLRPHHPGDLVTKCLPMAYDPSAACPTWEQFLRRIMGYSQGMDDPDMSSGALENRQRADEQAQALIDFQQRFVGYALTGETSEQCLCILHGSGANGKSTYLETLRALLGDYALSTPSASLLAKERHDGIPNDIARLRGARLVTAVEIGDGKKLDQELVKRLTGQDTVTARFLRAEYFDFTPEFKLMVACNHLPTIDGADKALWRRIHCIPFAVTIPEDEQDKDLGAHLRAELPGILVWAVRGCQEWQQSGLRPPDVVRETTAAYRSDMDSLGRFLDECCVRIDQASIKAGELYDAYKGWCSANGEAALTLTAMGKRLAERGFRKHHSNYVWVLGLGLKDLQAPEERPPFYGTD